METQEQQRQQVSVKKFTLKIWHFIPVSPALTPSLSHSLSLSVFHLFSTSFFFFFGLSHAHFNFIIFSDRGVCENANGIS